MLMKRICLIFLSLYTILISGCGTTKLPAGDVDIYKKYDSEIRILKSSLSPDSEMKFNAAKEIFDKVDFSFVKKPQTLFSILGVRDARGVSTGDGKQIQYRYRYKDKYILATFNVSGETIVAAHIKSKY